MGCDRLKQDIKVKIWVEMGNGRLNLDIKVKIWKRWVVIDST